MVKCHFLCGEVVWRPQGWLDMALRSKVLSQDFLIWTERSLVPVVPSPGLPHSLLLHSTDGYATVDRRERRTLGSDSTGETSEKELLKVSDSEQVLREALCLGLGKRTAM